MLPSTAAPRWSALRVVAAVGVLLPFLVIGAAPAHADSIGAKQQQAARLARQIDALTVRQSQLAEAYNQALLRVSDLNAKIAAAQSGLSSTGGLLGAARARVRDLAVSSYMRGGTAAELGMFVPKSTEELSVRNTYMRTVAGGANDAIDQLRQAHAQLGEQQAQLNADQAAATKALAAAESARRQAASADASTRAALAKVQGELAGLVIAARAQTQAAAAARLKADLARQSQRASRGRSLAVYNPGPLPPPPPGAAAAIAAARNELGKPYQYGGSGPDAFDCSGLTAWAWGHAGHPLPHSAAAQYSVTTHIPIADLLPGDLVFYGSSPHHVGIYVGNGTMINALHSGTNVEYDSIYIEGDLIGGGRVN